MKTKYYISYGSNMNIPQMAYRCPHSRIYGNGTLQGWKLVFNYHADIIETGEIDDVVPVVVWKITNKQDLANLDIYEGYPQYYIKRYIKVEMDDGEIVDAMVYVMADSRKGVYPPSRSYFQTILEGYEDNNINVKPLYIALAYSSNMQNITEINQYNPNGIITKYGGKYEAR